MFYIEVKKQPPEGIAMNHFPIFLNTAGRRIVLSGGGDAALAKLRILLKTTANVNVFAPDPAPEIEAWADAGKLDETCRRLFFLAALR